MATLMGCLLTLTACGTGSTKYVRGSSEVFKLEAGQAADIAGYLLSPQAYLDLADCCDACITTLENR